MSIRAEPGTAGRLTGGTPASGTAERRALADQIFRQVTVLPTLAAMAWLLTGLPLLLTGHFTWPLMLAIALPLAGVLVTLGLRWLSSPPDVRLDSDNDGTARTPWWPVAALIAVALAFGIDQFIYHSQQIIVQRDPGSYIQFATWIARHGSLPIPQQAAAFGGHTHLISFDSPAFYQVGHSIVPQFMAGLPMALAAAFWLGGAGAAAATGALLGSCGVLAFGGLVGRLVGPRWAPLGALVLAIALPEQFTSRSTYSEPLAQILFLGGLCLAIDSFALTGPARRKIAALAGLAIGLTLLVRIDGASDIMPLIPFCGLLILSRRPQAWPLAAGVIAGAAYGVVDGLVLSRPYLASISSSLLPLVAAGVILLVTTSVAVLVLRNRAKPVRLPPWVPNAAAALAFAVTIALTVRPYLQTVRGQSTAAIENTIATLQKAEHLPVQPTRQYYEISMHWVFWYLGVPAVALATVGAALLARKCLRGGEPAWTLPLMCFSWIVVATLLRPSIFPDQPWASRRLVPAVLPGFIVLALWAANWLHNWAREHAIDRLLRGCLVAVIAAALLLPAARTTFGIAHRTGGPLGIRLVAVGLAGQATFRGEVVAVRGLCAAIPRGSSVLFVTPLTGKEMAQVVRGMCGDPAAIVINPDRNNVQQLVADIQRAGRRPVLLGGSRKTLRLFDAQPRQVVKLRARADAHTLVRAPLYTGGLTIHIWMAVFPRLLVATSTSQVAGSAR